MGAVLQLERFDVAPASAAPELYGPAELAAAYARGRAYGEAAARTAESAALRAALSDAVAAMVAGDARRREEGRAAGAALAPLVRALVDGVLPALARARLEAALLDELLRLAETVTPLDLRLCCGADLEPFMSASLTAAGIAAVEIDTTGPAGTVTAEVLGGVIAWDEAAVAAQLRGIVQDIMEAS